MRLPAALLTAACLMSSLTLSAREKPDAPTPRAVDYEWMSVATWKERHEANVARAAQGDCDILLLGDSITEGWKNTTLWQEHFPKSKIVNFGVGGDTTANLLWRIQNGELGNLKPHLIVVMIGTNNLGRNHDAPAAVVVGVRALVSILQSQLPASKILVLGVLPADQQPKTKMRKHITTLNRRLAEVLHDGHSVFVVDVGSSVLEEDGTIAPATMGDFLHPTAGGYQRIANELFPRIDRLIGRF